MRLRRAVLWALLAALAAAGPATALVNGPLGYVADHPFAASAEDARVMVTASVGLTIPAVEGTQGYVNTTGFLIQGLERVCWEPREGRPLLESCAERSDGSLSIRVQDGGAFGLRLPRPYPASYDASFAITAFVDLSAAVQDAELDLGPSAVVFSQDGKVAFGAMPGLPLTAETRVPTPEEGKDRYGLLQSLQEGTVVEVRDADGVLLTERGRDRPVVFQGAPRVAPFGAELAGIPFGEDATASFTPGPPAEARGGIRFGAFQEAVAGLGEGGEGGAPPGLGEFDAFFGEVLNGALVRVPVDTAGRFTLDDLELVRFQRMDVAAEPDGLSWEGQAPLQVQGDSVVGASELVGVSYFRLPWWSFALWAVAIVLYVVVKIRFPRRADGEEVRLSELGPRQDGTVLEPQPAEEKEVLRIDDGLDEAEPAHGAGEAEAAPEAETPRAQPRPKGPRVPKWAGWLMSLAGFAVLFLLWDAEVAAVWGTSLLTTEAGGTALLVTAGVQLAPLMTGLFAAVAPVRLILRSGFSLAGVPGLRPIAGGIAYVVGFFLWATVLLSYIQLLLRAMVPAIQGAVG